MSTLRSVFRLPLVLVTLTGAALLAAAEETSTIEVALKSGEVVSGRLVEKTAERLTLQIIIISRGKQLTAQRQIPLSQVSRITTVQDEYRQRVANLGPSAQDLADLARWCREHGLQSEARTHAEKALAMESVNADARHLMHALDLAQIDGTWQAVDPWLASKGWSRLEGLIVDAAAKEKLGKLAATRSAAAQALNTTQQEQSAATSLLATASESAARLTKLRSETADSAAKAAQSKAAVEGAQKAYDQAKERVAAAYKNQAQNQPRANNQNQNQNQNQNNNQNRNAIDQAEAAQRKAQEALSAARAQATSADPARVKERLAKIDADLTANQAEQAKLKASAAAANAALPAKQAAADAANQAWKTALAGVTQPANLPPDLVAFLADQAPKPGSP